MAEFIEISQEEFDKLSMDEMVVYCHHLANKIVAEQDVAIEQYWRDFRIKKFYARLV